MKLGMFDKPATTNRTRFTSACLVQGGTTVWSRYFYQTQGASSMGKVATDAAAGWKVYFSFRPSNASEAGWDAIAGGSEDARWNGIGSMLAAIPNGGAWCFNHEPENDFGTSPNLYGSNAKGDKFCAAFNRVANIIKSYAPHWKASACLFDEVFPSYSYARGGNWAAIPDPNHWIPSTCDLLGVDYYAYRGGGDPPSRPPWATNSAVYDHRSHIADFKSYAVARSIKLTFPEFGYLIRDPALTPGDEANRTTWLNDVADVWADDTHIEAAMYFEVNNAQDSAKGNYSLTDPTQPPVSTGSVAAFVRFDGVDPPPPPPPPPVYLPGHITVGGHARMRTS